MEEVNGIRDGVFDDHPPCIPVNQLSGCGFGTTPLWTTRPGLDEKQTDSDLMNP